MFERKICINALKTIEIRMIAEDFRFFADQNAKRTNPQDILRENQRVLSVTYDAGEGVFTIIGSTNRYSTAAKQLIQEVWSRCQSEAYYLESNVAFHAREDRLFAYERDDSIYPVLDADLLQTILGVNLAYKNPANTKSHYPNRRGAAIYRVLLFIPSAMQAEQIILLLQTQHALALREVIIYQSEKFKYVLSVIENCDGISAFPEHATWNPIGMFGLSRDYPEFEIEPIKCNAFGKESIATEKDALDFSLYEMQWRLDGYDARNLQLPKSSEVKKVWLDKSAIRRLPDVLFTIPKHFLWPCTAQHLILSTVKTQYHTVATHVWFDAIAKPDLAWEISHKLWLGKCHNEPMTYPAGEELIGKMQIFLKALTSDALRLTNMPRELEGAVNDRSWKYIQDNASSIFSKKKWLEVYLEVQKEIDNVQEQKLPYEWRSVFKAVAVFLRFIEHFYTNIFVPIEGYKKHYCLLEELQGDLFPLLLLGAFPIKLLVTEQVTPCVCMNIHFSDYEVHDNMKYTGTRLALHDKEHRDFLHQGTNGPFFVHHVYRLLTNASRHALVCALFAMFDTLECEGGVLNYLSSHYDLGLTEAVKNAKREVDFLALALFILFHELEEPYHRASFFRVFEVGLPSLNEIQGAFFSIFRYTCDTDYPVLRLKANYSDWNEKSIEVFDFLPVNGASPMPFLILTSWLAYCFEQYKRDPDANLGRKECKEQFAKHYFEPMLRARLALVKDLLEKESLNAKSRIKACPIVSSGYCGEPYHDLHVLCSIDPKHTVIFNNPFFANELGRAV